MAINTIVIGCAALKSPRMLRQGRQLRQRCHKTLKQKQTTTLLFWAESRVQSHRHPKSMRHQNQNVCTCKPTVHSATGLQSSQIEAESDGRQISILSKAQQNCSAKMVGSNINWQLMRHVTASKLSGDIYSISALLLDQPALWDIVHSEMTQSKP